MHRSARTVLIWGVTFAISWLIGIVLGPVESFFVRLSPVSTWQLPRHAYTAVVLTLVASLISWLVSIVVGYATGIVASAAALSQKRATRPLWTIPLMWCVEHIRLVFEILFVVPLVLTLSLALTLLLGWNLERQIPRGLVLVGMILTSGVALAGHRVFMAVSDAVVNAAREDELLAESVYRPEPRRMIRPLFIKPLRRFFRDLQDSHFLAGCRIEMLAQAVEQAFHLAVVGVVIAETVAPGLYEYYFVQGEATPRWIGGIGKVISDGQNATNPELVAGAIWLIVGIDLVIVSIVRLITARLWLQHYRG